MKKNFVKYLIYGIIAGLGIFLLDLADVYFDVKEWIYFISFLIIPFIPMLLRRLKKGSSKSFSILFKIGILVSVSCIVCYTLMLQIYPKIFISTAEKTRLVDEKVNRMILDFDGRKIDIFAMEEKALSFFETSPMDGLLTLLLLSLFFLFICVLFALVLKTESGGDSLVEGA